MASAHFKEKKSDSISSDASLNGKSNGAVNGINGTAASIRPPVPKPDIPLDEFVRMKAANVVNRIASQNGNSLSGQPVSPNIAAIIDTSTDAGRNLIRGISSYSVKHSHWNLWVHSDSIPTSASTVKELGHGGVITDNPMLASNYMASGIPVVTVGVSTVAAIPSVSENFDKAAALAIDHFRERGLRNFAYVGPMQNDDCRLHENAFRKAVYNGGFSLDSFDCGDESVLPQDWSGRCKELMNWVGHLPKPTGIFTYKHGSSVQVINACRLAGVSVPDHVAVLAGQDDELICSTMSPSVSAIKGACEQIGYEAALQLDDLLNARPVTERARDIDPVLVYSRQSTEAIAINDPDLLAAVRFIREHACGGINVQEVADSVPIGRRSLERKFKEHFGRTPLDEIQRLRLGRVRELLIKTDLPVSRIASDAGFGTPEYMTTMFKSRFGLTPLKFRSQTRAR